VGGRRYYDAMQDRAWRTEMQRERGRLITRMLAAKRAGAPVRKAERKEEHNWECETLGEQP